MSTVPQTSDAPHHWRLRIASAYSRIPLIRALPLRATGIVVILIVVNLIVWVAVGIVSVSAELLTTDRISY